MPVWGKSFKVCDVMKKENKYFPFETKEEEKTFYAQMEALKKAWKGFVEEVQKEIGEWMENFLDKMLICGNCVHYDYKAVAWDGQKKTHAGFCKEKKYWVHRDCHSCRAFGLIKNPRMKENEKKDQ